VLKRTGHKRKENDLLRKLQAALKRRHEKDLERQEQWIQWHCEGLAEKQQELEEEEKNLWLQWNREGQENKRRQQEPAEQVTGEAEEWEREKRHMNLEDLKTMWETFGWNKKEYQLLSDPTKT
jgi:hypothetical protein